MSDRFVKDLELFLFKVQTDNETEQTSLDATDFIQVTDGSTFGYTNDGSEIKLVSGKFDQEAWVPGKREAEITLITVLKNFGVSGAEVSPDFGKLLRCCDFVESTNNGYYIYTPSSDGGESGTGWAYDGKTGTSNLMKGANLKGDWKIAFESAKHATIESTLKGFFSAYTTGTVPTVTRNRVATPALLSGTFLVNGSAYNMISGEIMGNQSVEVTDDMSTAHGCGQSKIKERAIKMSVKVYTDLQSTLDPIGALQASTSGAVQVYWGASSEIRIDAGYSQITEVGFSDQNGIRTYDLSLQLNRNDFTLRVLGAAASSSSSSSSS